MFKRSLDIQNHRQLFEKQSKKSPPHSRFHPWLIPRHKRGPRDALTKSRWSRRLNMRTWSNVTTATTGDVTQPMSQIISGMMMSEMSDFIRVDVLTDRLTLASKLRNVTRIFSKVATSNMTLWPLTRQSSSARTP